MDNYIIRIYRRDPRDPQKITGMAEAVETDVKRSFADFEQLREILNRGTAGKAGGRLPRSTRQGRKK